MKYIYIILVSLFAIVCLNSCSEPDIIIPLLKQNVILASGVSFDSKQLVSLDPFTGFVINPCGTTDDIFVTKYSSENKSLIDKSRYIQNGTRCNTQVVNADTSLKQALIASNSPIKGQVRVNGEDREATFVITVTALYPGSHCTTLFSGGKQLKRCIKKEQECEALTAAGLPC